MVIRPVPVSFVSLLFSNVLDALEYRGTLSARATAKNVGEFVDRTEFDKDNRTLMIFRLSQKLVKKIKTDAIETLPLGENHYADWSARLFTVDRTQYIILSNTKSLYSTVMFGKGITNEKLFIDRALTTIREFMQDDAEQFA